MNTTSRFISVIFLCALAQIASSNHAQTQAPAQPASEPARLAMLLRQLETLERLAQDATQLAGDGERYRFDYARLSEDLKRVRAGIEGHLTPSRAQPRDSQALIGAYRRESIEKP
jgi:RAQPRD family integrative conjugative element protein